MSSYDAFAAQPDPGTIPPDERAAFIALIEAAQRLLLRVDRPYLALCLDQFRTMALAAWPDVAPAPARAGAPMPAPLRD